MKWVAIAVALAGCQQVFGIRKLPDAAVIDAPPMCPPGIGHDEDGDCVPDTADDCPGLADAAQLDTDQDGVGDACDPDVGASNQLVVFVPFDQVSEENRWTSAGSWIVNDDDFSNADATSTTEDWSYRTPDLFAAGNEIEARITIGTFTPGTDIKIGVGFYEPPGGALPPEWSCAVHQPKTGSAKADAFDNGIATFRDLAPPGLFAEAATYTIRMRFTTGQVQCDIRGDAGDVAATTTMNTAPTPTQGYLAVYTQSAAAQVHHVAVYSAM